MKNTNQIHQLTSEIRLFLRDLQNISSLVEKAMIYEAKTDTILTLLSCETFGNTNKKIRSLLESIFLIYGKNNYQLGEWAKQALALLPCETCGETEIKPPEEGCGDCLAVDGSCWTDCPCPDCQIKELEIKK